MVHTSYPEDPLQQFLSHFGSDFDIDSSIDDVNSLLESVPLPECDIPLNEPVELLQVEVDSDDVPDTLIPTPPTQELKPLPEEL
ncbi:hypothetical protein FRX31_002250, partial [Thalictrum thalictroides]